MRRIAVIGCGGSGKSYLSRQLAARLGIPAIHLDSLYYQKGSWIPHEVDTWRSKHRDLVAQEAWVLDGNYLATLPERLHAADTVIFLDLPTATCLRRVCQRRLRWPHRARPDVIGAERVTLGFLRYVISFRRKHRPRVLSVIAASRCRVVSLQSPSEVAAFLEQISD